MDLDVDMGDSADVAQESFMYEQPVADDILQPDDAAEPGEVADDEPAKEDEESNKIVPYKLHVRGLDTLHTDDIKAYVRAKFGVVDKVEWIDDTSANLVFASDVTARDALIALSAIDIGDVTALPPGETVLAHPVDGKPEVSLNIRFSVQSDRKQAGAALRSRYYLLHPEHDPEERRRQHRDSRSKYRDRDDDHYRNGRRGRRNSDDEVETFEASMYDDVPRAERSRQHSDSDERPRSYARENRGKELFAGRSARRDRSASPLRDRDGDEDMDSLGAGSSRNRRSARSIKDRLSADNRSKELFPTKGSSNRGGQLDQLEDAIGSARLKEEDRPKVVAAPDAPSGGAFNIRGIAAQRRDGQSGFAIKGAAVAGANAKELFPGKLGTSNAGVELFDSNRSRRRQKAEDLFS